MPGGELAKFEKIDDYTLQIEFAVPYKPILSILRIFWFYAAEFLCPGTLCKEVAYRL